MIAARRHPTKKCVAHVTLGLDVGGQEKLLVEFARHVDRARFDLVFISLTSRGKLADTLETLGWPVHALDEPTALRPGIVWRLARLLAQQNIDIVHSHDDRPLVYAVPAARLVGVSRVIHTHHHGLLGTLSSRRALLLRVAARCTDRFVCVSQDSARYMIERGVPPNKVSVLRNGIDLDRFPYQGPDAAGPIVTVARLNPEKNLDVLVDAMIEIARQRPGTTLEIAGDGPLRERLARQTVALKLADRVRFLGEVHDVPGLLARASLFVLPSKTEGISLTLLEAMARGLPVVATRVGGNPEVVADGVTGLLVPAGAPHELAECMLRVLAHPHQAHAMGVAGRQRVENHFGIRRMIAEYEDLYLDRSRP